MPSATIGSSSATLALIGLSNDFSASATCLAVGDSGALLSCCSRSSTVRRTSSAVGYFCSSSAALWASPTSGSGGGGSTSVSMSSQLGVTSSQPSSTLEGGSALRRQLPSHSPGLPSPSTEIGTPSSRSAHAWYSRNDVKCSYSTPPLFPGRPISHS